MFKERLNFSLSFFCSTKRNHKHDFDGFLLGSRINGK
jgi:hypothetical protein